MNISELIEELKEVKKEHGDLEVRVWADHGQQCMTAYSVGTQWVDETYETYAQEDIDDGEVDCDDLTKVLEIAG